MAQRLFEEECLKSCLLSQALDGLNVGLVLVNASGRIIWHNRAAARALDLDPSSCYGMAVTRAIKDPQLLAFWHDAVSRDETVVGEVVVHHPCRADLKINITQSVDSDGTHLGRAILFCDVTDERSFQVQMSQEVATRLLDLTQSHAHNGGDTPANGLTAQEIRVLRCVGEGLSNDEIAGKLHIAPSTLRSHLKHVYRKLDLRTRAEAVRYAVENQLC
jgi:DNA-binding CsgD family transcriptional regulator